MTYLRHREELRTASTKSARRRTHRSLDVRKHLRYRISNPSVPPYMLRVDRWPRGGHTRVLPKSPDSAAVCGRQSGMVGLWML